MKIKIPPGDASVLEMNNWIAELRDDGGAEPADDGGRPDPAQEATAAAPPADMLAAHTGSSADVESKADAEDGADAEHGAAAGSSERAAPTERAAIGDQLRIPIAWCELGSCIAHHADPAALGEADIRARAISAGWRLDGLGRLACPTCQQNGSGFWASHPVALWDRDVAITRAYLMAVAMRNTAAVGRAGKSR